MTWTPAQEHSIIMHYAHEGIAFCPHGHGPLVPVLVRVAGASQPITTHRCPVCGKETRSNPLALATTH